MTVVVKKSHCCCVDGAGEFLDAWLLLMEKLTNPKNILDSPYVFGVKTSEPAVFSPLQYLVQIQKV